MAAAEEVREVGRGEEQAVVEGAHVGRKAGRRESSGGRNAARMSEEPPTVTTEGAPNVRCCDGLARRAAGSRPANDGFGEGAGINRG